MTTNSDPPEVLTLTDAQADVLRDERRRVYKAVDEVAAIRDVFLRLCEHVDPERPDICRVCRLYKCFESAAGELHEAPDAIDQALRTGPLPASRRGKS